MEVIVIERDDWDDILNHRLISGPFLGELTLSPRLAQDIVSPTISVEIIGCVTHRCDSSLTYDLTRHHGHLISERGRCCEAVAHRCSNLRLTGTRRFNEPKARS